MGKKHDIVRAVVSGLLWLNPVPLWAVPAAQNPSTQAAAPAQTAEAPSREAAQQELQALQDAVRSSEDNPQVLIKNLEAFLERFPASARREQVLQFIYKSALRANDPQTAIQYGEQWLAMKPDDPALLSSLVGLLEGQDDASSRAKALQYATRFVERAEKQINELVASAAGKEHSPESLGIMLAAAYSMRGKLYAKSGEWDKAAADLQKSYAAYPSPQLAQRLGDLAAKKNDLERALDDYATAFAFPGPGLEPSEREEVRRKLGSCYVALHASEKGLGDLVLARYDELERTLAPRFQDSRQPNANLRDPFAYVLKRPDGSSLSLADYRGKVLVLEFWATWCGPCRVEGKLLERVVETFRNEPAAVFLAVNVDQDQASVPAFVKEEQWTTPVVYAQGLDRLLGVQSLPTLLIFDRNGHVVFRLEGLAFSSFVETVERKVRETLEQAAVPSPP
jgi:thiol-disulfide isomerase/thioredoxin